MRRLLGAGLLAALLVFAAAASSADTFDLRVVSQTTTTITLGWDRQPGYGYLFSADGQLVSRTNDAARENVKFSKTYSSYEVAVIVKGATGTYPPAAPPPPPPPPPAVCSDGIDNDADGKVDYPADLGCLSASDTDETDPATGGTAPWLGSMNASYQAAQPGQTIVMPGGTYGSQVVAYRALSGCDQNNPASLVTISVPATVTINGNLEVHGNCVFVKGVTTGTMADWKARTFTINVTGYTSVEGDSQSQYPRNVRIEGVNTGNFGTYSSNGVLVRDMDVGPRLLDLPCAFPENRIASNGATGGVIPRNVVWDRVAIHDQNRTQAAANADCHYGGLQFWASENVTLTHIVMERNVVYHVDVGESGFGPTNGVISQSSFSCPADNSWVGDRCDGQKAVQFDTPANYASTFTLSGNVAANGTGGLFGCYSEPCGFAGMTVAGNIETNESATAPAVP